MMPTLPLEKGWASRYLMEPRASPRNWESGTPPDSRIRWDISAAVPGPIRWWRLGMMAA